MVQDVEERWKGWEAGEKGRGVTSTQTRSVPSKREDQKQRKGLDLFQLQSCLCKLEKLSEWQTLQYLNWLLDKVQPHPTTLNDYRIQLQPNLSALLPCHLLRAQAADSIFTKAPPRKKSHQDTPG